MFENNWLALCKTLKECIHREDAWRLFLLIDRRLIPHQFTKWHRYICAHAVRCAINLDFFSVKDHEEKSLQKNTDFNP